MASLDGRYNFFFHIVYEIRCTLIDRIEDENFLILGHMTRTVGQAMCSFTGRICDFRRDRCAIFRNLVNNAKGLGINDQQFLDEIFSKQTRECYRKIQDPELGNKWVKFIKLRNTKYVNVNGDRELMNRIMGESMAEFERRNYGMVPASESSVGKMLKKVIMKGENWNCTICLEEIEKGTEVTIMPCKHEFRSECIVRWLKESHYCPICRCEMPIN